METDLELSEIIELTEKATMQWYVMKMIHIFMDIRKKT